MESQEFEEQINTVEEKKIHRSTAWRHRTGKSVPKAVYKKNAGRFITYDQEKRLFSRFINIRIAVAVWHQK